MLFWYPDLLGNLAIDKAHDPVTPRRASCIMSHEYDRHAKPIIQAPQQRDDLTSRNRVEIPCRFVGQEKSRRGDQCTRNRNPLHFSP